jgi:hypothetical protein
VKTDTWSVFIKWKGKKLPARLTFSGITAGSIGAGASEMNRKPKTKRTPAIRQGVIELTLKLAKSLPDEAFVEAGQTLGLVQGDVLLDSSEEASAILFDFALYHHRIGGRNVIERFLHRSPPPPDSEEFATLQAMSRARYSLFEVRKIEEENHLELFDLIRSSQVKLLDQGLSQTAHKGLVLATRIIPFPEHAVTTGAAMPVSPDLLESLEAELQPLLGPKPFSRPRRLTKRQETELVPITIRHCLSEGALEEIRFT